MRQAGLGNVSLGQRDGAVVVLVEMIKLSRCGALLRNVREEEP